MKVKISSKAHFTTHLIFVVKDLFDIKDYKGEANEITVRYDDDLTLIYCGIGDKESCSSGIIRAAAIKGIQKAIELRREDVSVFVPEVNIEYAAESALEGSILGTYKFSKYKSEKPHELNIIEFTGSSLTTSQINTISASCESVMFARDLVNDNATEVTPEYLARESRKLEKKGALKVTILDEKDLEKKGLNLINVVGQASETPPRLIVIEYTGNPKSKTKTAIVGKGITFDSGGQNLKPTGSIESMRDDMAGAATVLGVMRTLSIIKPKVNCVGVIATAHNNIGGNAYFPGDTYKSYSGKTVEIWSTDAEGRLVLADAIAYCQDHYKPTEIIDLATLTGGVLYALGEFAAGLFSNDDILASELFNAGETTNERLWRLPLYKEYSDSIKGDIGDLRNVSKLKKGYASSITGAAFIQEFVKDVPWAHLDIAGTAFNDGGARGDIPQFATGFGVRMLLEYLRKKQS
jgi:leucyl aminopeptidase